MTWGTAECLDLVTGVNAGEPWAEERLYELSAGFQRYFRKQVGHERDLDLVHDLYLVISTSIHQQRLRDPTKLLAFAATAARFLVWGEYTRAKRRGSAVELEVGTFVADQHPSSECEYSRRERLEVANKVLSTLVESQREILVRFYLLHQDKKYIQSKMNITPTQFRLLKSTAKTEFGRRGKQIVVGQPTAPASGILECF